MPEHFFTRFNSKGKILHIQRNGILLATRINSRFIIELYQFECSYLEIWYDPTSCIVSKIKPCKSDKCPEPYLAEINIEDLYKGVL
jgi:hypothetical protein